jgi:hypothetical protein
MDKEVFKECELAVHWGISPKTLQRWRCTGYGPKYLKLNKLVLYPIHEVLEFEKTSLVQSTSQNSSIAKPKQNNSRPLNAREVALTVRLPTYWFTNINMRQKLGIPCVHIGKVVRFNLAEVKAWARRYSEEIEKTYASAGTKQTDRKGPRRIAIERLSLI